MTTLRSLTYNISNELQSCISNGNTTSRLLNATELNGVPQFNVTTEN